ncbi:hypothetical protein J6590_049706 [Homalodisca vitripennis]|nr:hypothetical protein J6590_049706 [Homalodisca vitripennis]
MRMSRLNLDQQNQRYLSQGRLLTRHPSSPPPPHLSISISSVSALGFSILMSTHIPIYFTSQNI